MLHQAVRGALPRKLKLRDQAHLSLLIRADILAPGDGEQGGIEYLQPHPDVLFSLALEEVGELRIAETTVRTVRNRKLLPKLSGDGAGSTD